MPGEFLSLDKLQKADNRLREGSSPREFAPLPQTWLTYRRVRPKEEQRERRQ